MGRRGREAEGDERVEGGGVGVNAMRGNREERVGKRMDGWMDGWMGVLVLTTRARLA